MTDEQREQIEWALDTLQSKGWKEVIVPEFTEAYIEAMKDLRNPNNSHETDIALKEKVNQLDTFIHLEEEFKKRLDK